MGSSCDVARSGARATVSWHRPRGVPLRVLDAPPPPRRVGALAEAKIRGMKKHEGASPEARSLVATTFTWIEDVIYVSLGVLLALSAVAVLIHGGVDLVRAIFGGLDVHAIITLLDRVLLALMITEMLYTVKVSFREHVLSAEPFLVVALIAAVRRILVITAEFGAQMRPDDQHFRQVIQELALLTVLILVLVASAVMLRRRAPAVEA